MPRRPSPLAVSALLVATGLAGLAALPSAGAAAARIRPADTPALLLDISAGDPVDRDASGDLDAGDVVPFTYTLTNDGPTPLSSIVVSDALGDKIDCPDQGSGLAASAVLVCHSEYAITQQNLDAGTVDNTASAVGTTPDGESVTAPTDSTATILNTFVGLSLTRSSAEPFDANGDGRVDAGDYVRFGYQVTNTGNRTLTQVTVHDTASTSTSCESVVLAPGQTTACVGAHPLTQEDVDAGRISGTAVASAVAPAQSVVDSPSRSAVTLLPASPAVGLTVTWSLADLDGDGVADPGERITYLFAVDDPGSTTLSKVTVHDPGLTSKGTDVSCPSTRLFPGQNMGCTATYTVKDDDVGEPITTTAHVQAMSATVITSRFVRTSVPTDGTGRPAHGTRHVAAGLWAGGAALLVLVLATVVVVVRRRRRWVPPPPPHV